MAGLFPRCDDGCGKRRPCASTYRAPGELWEGDPSGPVQCCECAGEDAPCDECRQAIDDGELEWEPAATAARAEVALLYRQARSADDAFQRGLEDTYGRRAGDMRYRTGDLPGWLRDLALAHQAACARLLEACRRAS